MAVSPETLVSYVPALIARRFAANPAPLTAPVAEHFPAAILFADITGYSTMAARLAQHGPAGAEELIQLLNAYFGRLIDLVLAHGGDIIKFAGDAAIVLWPAVEESLPLVTQRAAQCGLAMQTTLGPYEVAEGLRLSLRVGIGAGQVLTACVGGVFGRWEFLVAGEPLSQMSAAQRQAQPGQTLLSPEAWAMVQDRCGGQRLPEGHVLLEAIHAPLPPRRLTPVIPVAGSEAALRGYIPGAILSRLDAGQTAWLSELRRVTVVFLNVTGIDYAAPNVLDRIQATMRGLQTALYYYEGSVNQFIVDDKGTTLVAAFGLPPLTHEDDALRGVQAAMMMQARLRELGLQGAIGVTTGQVYSGERGNALRREYAMVGDVVNMAARLMQAAAQYKGSAMPILCDEATFHAASTRLAFDALEPILVKGKTTPIPVYRPRGAVSREVARYPSTTLVGRSAEQTLLTGQLQALLKGQSPGLILLEGEAGIGKSRLVEALVQQARALNVSCLIGAGDAVEKSTPYHAWRHIFSQLFGLEAIADLEARRARVLEHLQSSPGLLRLAPLLNVVLPLDWPDNDITRQMEGQVRADNTRDLLVRLLQAAAQQVPTLLVLEDAHWMDSASWVLSLVAGQQIQPIMLVIVTRPLTGSLPEEYRQLLLLATGMRWIRLEALSPEDTLALVCQRLGVAALPEPVATLIRDKAQGNPFFSLELAYALRDAGLILVAEGQCQMAPEASDPVSGQLLGAVSLPDTVQGVITSRIDRLTPAQQLTLKVASVIGRSFALRLLRDVYPIEADKVHLADYLSILQQTDLIAPEHTGQETYTFKNAVIQETAYNLMLFAQRRQLHTAIAGWYERTYADDLPAFYPLLAHHWSKVAQDAQADSELVAKAIDYLEKAGEQALYNYANQEAVRFFSEALALDERRDRGEKNLRRARWARQLGEAYLSLGRLAESRQQLERAVALLGRPAPTTRWTELWGLTRQVLSQAIHRLTSGLGVLFRRWQSTAAQLEAARAYWVLGQIYFYANETLANIHANLGSLNLAEGAGPSPELARSYASVCIAAGLLRHHRLARMYARRACEVASQINHSPSLGWVMLVTAVYEAGVGHWLQARAAVGQAIEISNRQGDRRRWEQSLNTLATVACLQGEFAGIASLFADLYESARRRGDAQYQVYGLLGQARCLLSLGQIDQALELLDLAGPLLDRNLGRVEEIYTYGLLAWARLRQGQWPPARQAADQAAQLIAQSRPISYNLIFAYAGVAEVYLTLWENGDTDLKPQAERACNALHQFAQVFPIGQPADWICRGLYDWLAGYPRRARHAWQKGLAAAERLEMPYEQGWAHYELGRHAAAQEQQAHLTQARELWARLGAAYDLRRVDDSLSQPAPRAL